MKQSAETTTAVDISGEVGRWRDQQTTRSGRNEAQRPMRTVTIVMVDERVRLFCIPPCVTMFQ